MGPQSLTVLVGQNATIDCVGPEGTTGYQWITYDSDDNISTTNISVPEDRLFSSQTYTDVQLNTIHMVQCVVLAGNKIHSKKVTLKVVGE